MAKLIIWMFTFFITICCLNSQINALDKCDGDKLFFKCNNKRCVSRSMTCNNVNDCGDNSDEINCADNKIDSTFYEKSCNIKDQFKCKNGNCISSEKVCNRVDDCFDGSDEYENCEQHRKCKSSEFTCKNNYCIPSAWVCDKENDCGDNSDEECDPGKNDPCATGNVFNNNSQTCEDIDECSGTYHIQACDHVCKNLLGSYACYCNYGYSLDSDGKTCIMNNHHIEPLLIFSTNTEIKEYRLKTNLYYPSVVNISGATAIAQNDNYTYWSDNKNIYRIIKKSNDKNDLSTKSMNESEIVIKFGTGQIHDIEIDWITGNIYFTDNLNHRILACTANGSYCTIINDNNHVSKINGLALNPPDKNMYWIEGGHECSIYRSKMDGRYPQAIVTTNLTNSHNLVVDYPAKRIYWTNDKGTTKRIIESSDFDGKNRRIIVDNFTINASIMHVFEDNLYWYDSHFKTIEYCKKLHCKIRKTLVNENNKITGISVYHPIIKTVMNNPCLKKSCSEMCLLSHTITTCACSIGKKLLNDGVTCSGHELNDKYLIVSTDTKVMSYHNNILSKAKITINYSYKTILSMVYDAYNDQLIIIDDYYRTISKYNLINNQVFKIFSRNSDEVSGMSYDYYGNNLYITNTEKNIIEIYSLTTFKTAIINVGQPLVNIIVIPEKAIMFVAYIVKNNNNTISIDKMSMSGNERINIKDNISGTKLPMTTDGNLLFYAEKKNIFRVNITSYDITFVTNEIGDILSLAILNDELYWIVKKTLYWCNKYIDKPQDISLETLDIDDNAKSLLLTTVKNNLKIKKHNCSINNGGCSHLCLVVSPTEYTCACSNNMILLRDQKTCIHKDQDDIETINICPEYTCDNGECIAHQDNCNGKNDCSDGSDEGKLCNIKCSTMKPPCDHTCQETPHGPRCFCLIDHDLIDNKYCHRIDHCLNEKCSQLCQPHGESYNCSCFTGFKLNNDGITCNHVNTTKFSFTTSHKDMRKINVELNNIEIITTEYHMSTVGYDYDAIRGYVYYSNSLNIVQLNIQNHDRKVLNHIGSPSFISVDWVTGNIFFVSQNKNILSINVANMNNENLKHKSIVSTKVKSDFETVISSISVVPKNGLLFWSNNSFENGAIGKIFKSNMTGDGVEIIVENNAKIITDVAVDHHHDWIYWVDAVFHLVSRCKFDGSKRELFKKIHNVEPFGLTIFENSIYWLPGAMSNLERCLLYGNKTCQTIPINGTIVDHFVISHVSRQIIGKNYCENTKCDYMCVLNGSENFACIDDSNKKSSKTDETSKTDEINEATNISKTNQPSKTTKTTKKNNKKAKQNQPIVSSTTTVRLIAGLFTIFIVVVILVAICICVYNWYKYNRSPLVYIRNICTTVQYDDPIYDVIPTISGSLDAADSRQALIEQTDDNNDTEEPVELDTRHVYNDSSAINLKTKNTSFVKASHDDDDDGNNKRDNSKTGDANNSNCQKF